MLKKQTVWLLTMLSLMVVLSVFYMQDSTEDDFAFIFEEDAEESGGVGSLSEQENEPQSTDTNQLESDQDQDNQMSAISSNDELFTMIRMELAQSRSSRLEQLESLVATSSTSNEEKNQAYDEMKQIDQIATKELIVEETLKSENGYPDVLVRTSDDSVIVTVKTDQLSEKEANAIMQMVYDEFGSIKVEVKFQPTT